MLEGRIFLSRRSSVATEHPMASVAATEALQEGGNAFDAAVAASFALAVVQPHLSGLGGDFVALLYSEKERRVCCINSTGWSPSASAEMLRSAGRGGVPLHGPLSAVVPGYVDGVFRMHTKFGRLKFSRLLAKAVELAEDGFPTGKGLARAVTGDAVGSAREVFMPEGRAPRVGEVLSQPALARAIRSIGEHGPKAFYEGSLSASVSAAMSEDGAKVDPRDLADFEAEWCEPISVRYGDAEVYEVPPNSMGATTLLILKLLEKRELGRLNPDSHDRINATLGAVREAYMRRDAVLGDPRFVGFDLEGFLRNEDPSRGYAPISPIDNADTTYFAVSDADGNILSCIQSLFHHFGSRVFVREGGFFLNNRGSAFRLTGPNAVAPRKRPLHTLSSLLVSRGGTVTQAVGCSGGDFRPQQHALLVTNITDYSMSLEEAIGFPRFLLETAEQIKIEDGYEGLEKVEVAKSMLGYPGRTGVAQGVEVLPDCRKAVCDVRGEGIPLGM